MQPAWSVSGDSIVVYRFQEADDWEYGAVVVIGVDGGVDHGVHVGPKGLLTGSPEWIVHVEGRLRQITPERVGPKGSLTGGPE